MNIRILVLSVLVAVSGGAAWLLSSEPKQQQVQSGPGPLFERLARDSQKVSSVKIESHNGVLFQADRSSGRWLANHLSPDAGFPVNTRVVSSLITGLSRARVVEKKTSKPENYARLGVEDLSSSNARSVRVTLSDGKDSWQVLLGNNARQQGGMFVRLDGDPASLLIDQRLRLPASATDWLASAVLPFREDALEQIEFSQPATTALLLARKPRNEQQWHIVTDGTALAPIRDEELAYPQIISQTITDMLDFRFLSVRPYQQARWEAHPMAGRVVFTLADNTQVMAQIKPAAEPSQYLIWIDSPDSPSWVSDWIFTVSAYQGKAYLTNLGSLLAR